jgi:MFS family permease
MSAPKSSGPQDERYGWVMVGVTFLLSGLAFGSLGSVGIFLKPLIADFGWTRGEASAGYTTMAVASGICGIFWGIAADRFPLRYLVLIGVLTMSASLLLLGNLTTLWQYYLFYFLFGAAGHGALVGPLYATTGHWFRRNPGIALGIMTAGSGVGQGTVPFIARMLISDGGWQSAYTILGISYLIIGLPVVFLVRESSARLTALSNPGKAADEDAFVLPPKEVVAWLSFAVIFCCICMAVPIVQLVPLVSDRGVDPELAAGVILVLMLSGAVGRVFAGRLADKIGALQSYIIMGFGQAVLVVWFPFVTSVVGTYILAAAFGLIYSGVMANIIICLRIMVPARFAGRAMGVGGAFALGGMGFGGFFGGYLFDVTGSYVWSFTTAGAIGLVNVVVTLAFLARVRRQERLVAATA